jgi:phage repressor protein C with HTH and peptisase S24 domain
VGRLYSVDFSDRLRALVELFDSRVEAAAVAGVTSEQLGRYLSGDTKKVPFEVLSKLAAAKRVSLDWLATGEGQRSLDAETPEVPDDSISIPLYRFRASAGPGAFAWDEEPSTRMTFPRAVLLKMGVNPAAAMLTQASGDSMYPTISDGNLMLLDRSDIDIVDDVFMLRRGDSILVKRLQQRMDGSIALRSDNPAYEEERLPRDEADELQVIGRVRMTLKAV